MKMANNIPIGIRTDVGMVSLGLDGMVSVGIVNSGPCNILFSKSVLKSPAGRSFVIISSTINSAHIRNIETITIAAPTQMARHNLSLSSSNAILHKVYVVTNATKDAVGTIEVK